MNAEDRWLSDVERDASPERFHAQSASTPGAGETRDPAATLERHEPMERTVTAMSSSTSSSLSSGIPNDRRETTMSRTATQADLERHPTALSRIQTGRSQHSGTVGASLRSRTATRHSRTALPAFGAGKPYPPNLPDREEYVVEFDGPDDPLHAHNWPLRKKLPVTIVLGYVTLTAAFGSSIFSTATGAIATQFDLSREVGILGVSLYVLGFATGPILWGEYYTKAVLQPSSLDRTLHITEVRRGAERGKRHMDRRSE